MGRCLGALVASGLLLVSLHGCSGEPVAGPGSGEYSFSRDSFTSRIGLWTEVLAPLRGKPDLCYLEIGVDEGRSAIWMLENVLTHPTSTLVAVDTFHREGVLDTFRANLEVCGCSDRVRIITGRSQVELRNLRLASCDVVYVDGSHTAWGVMTDAVHAWSLLEEGGLLLFDDYGWREDLPSELRPQAAIDAFISAFRYEVEVVHQGYQVILRKRPNPCADRYQCSPFAHYVFLWMQGRLYDLEAPGWVELTVGEREALEEVLRARIDGGTGFSITDELRTHPDLATLETRLGVDFTTLDNPAALRDEGGAPPLRAGGGP